MRMFTVLIYPVALLCTSSSQAALVAVNASADMTHGLPYTISVFPVATTVTADVTFNLGTGIFSGAAIDNVSGTFTWVDDTLGIQSFNAGNAAVVSTGVDGSIITTRVAFFGNGPTIGGLTVDNFRISFIGDAITPAPELVDFVLASSIGELRVGVRDNQGFTQFGDLESNVSGTVKAVPIPSTSVLITLGLFVIAVKPRWGFGLGE